MIRVLQVFDSLEISGGVQAVIMNAYRAIDRTKIQFDFAHYHNPDDSNSYREEIEALGGRVIKIKCLSEAGFKGFYDQFVKLFSKNHYDAVHAHNIHHNGIILLAAKRCGIKNRISHGHQAFDEYNDKSYRRLIAKALMKLNSRVATKKVACSDLAAEFLYGKKQTYIFIPNAVDLKCFEELPSKEELRKKNGFSSEERILIHIGRMAPPKNQNFLIDIIEKLKDTEWKLLIIGDGELKPKLVGYIKEKKLDNKVELLGLRSDCPELLKMADIMLLPSIYEGMPVVAIEAQAAGCMSLISDVVTKQVDAQMELIEYLPISDAQTWADRIMAFQANTAVKANHEEVIKTLNQCGFGSDENAKRWMRLYIQEKE